MKAAYFNLAISVGFGLFFFSSSSPVLEVKILPSLVKRIQEASSLKVAANLVNKTEDYDRRPRCGVTNLNDFQKLPNVQPFQRTDLTYRIQRHTPDLQENDVNKIIAAALNAWASVTPLTFTPTTSISDIEITFAAGEHGDGSSFDGRNGVLAHAFGPGTGLGGDIHFDEAETWTTGSEGINLFLVAVHEAGHALGLDHSNDPNSIMAAFYQFRETIGFLLPEDDRKGIQSLYGPPLMVTPTTGTVPNFTTNMPIEPPTENPPACDPNLFADAALTINRRIVLFKDGFFRLSRSSVINRVEDSLPGAPSNVDAAFATRGRAREIFLFQDSQYWRFKRNVLDSGSPHPISDFGFPSSVNRIDAAMRINRRIIMFFVGDQLWRYKIGEGMDDTSPIPITTTFEENDHVDAAFKSRGNIYLINGSTVSKYNRALQFVRKFETTGWLDCA
ncbi:macrophage metalloelastase-like [Leucoraja erinacea]|uniref:macrophage metalloelastase-like n=1 Tax=Leucoraja erinaceus TaxID=7782 RepID=UPI002454B936|nr:macrophage metalloelastase-like [Leucoraja erinacea]